MLGLFLALLLAQSPMPDGRGTAIAPAEHKEPPPCPGLMIPWRRSGTPEGAWRERRLWSATDYELEQGLHTEVMHASCSASASARYYEFKKGEPIPGIKLCWSWRAVTFPAGENLNEKDGDDRAATVAAVFNKSRLPWRARAIFYVWSSVHEPGTIIENPYASGVKMMVLRKGAQGWQTEERDLAADYVKAFGEPAPMLEAVGILTDSDNTASKAEAYYGPLVLKR